MRLNVFRSIKEWWQKRAYLKKARVMLKNYGYGFPDDRITAIEKLNLNDGWGIRVVLVAARPDDPKKELLIFDGEAIGVNESGTTHIMLPYGRYIAVPPFTLCVIMPPLRKDDDFREDEDY